ncbi:MAG: S-adenosylmethionine:tRNA ribosyltransferase-isomerase [Flavobacteriales bacterium]|jgi:S-adenosylmethionine:tRNA ribosyltransferase-isomerase
MSPQEIHINDYDYILPQERIPHQPLPERSSAALLVYEKGIIRNQVFRELPALLEAGDTLFINDTRVIPARMIFHRVTGARIEVFCLEPWKSDYQQVMESSGPVRWLCMVGGARKWKDNCLSMELPATNDRPAAQLQAFREEDMGDGQFLVRFEWEGSDDSFAAVMERAGRIPLPPYFNREVMEEDEVRYQTVFARFAGSVAAPTAGLHFTPEVMDELNQKGVNIQRLTLHVGAGTFRPVASEKLRDHPMHGEWFEVRREVVEALTAPTSGRRIPVGTTSMRTLESLYWLGVKAAQGILPHEPSLGQWEPYELDGSLSLREAMLALCDWMDKQGAPSIKASTSLLIGPGYSFHICDGLITNFHMPRSTLLVLVAALIGDDWKRVYAHALNHDYRFLSYGDSSLLLP